MPSSAPSSKAMCQKGKVVEIKANIDIAINSIRPILILAFG
jgi:hypothetical protein